MICQNTYKTFLYYSKYVKYIYFVFNTYIQTTCFKQTYEMSDFHHLLKVVVHFVNQFICGNLSMSKTTLSEVASNILLCFSRVIFDRSRNVQQSRAVAACFSGRPDPQTPSQLEAGHLPSSFGQYLN